MIDKIKKWKYSYRLSPCPAYDIEGIESWLDSMARKGYFLSGDKYYPGVFIFEKGNAKFIKYRLEVQPESKDKWIKTENAPSNELLTKRKECGWEYIDNLGDFYIFASEIANFGELNTDLKAQALAIDRIRKKKVRGLYAAFLGMGIVPIILKQSNFIRTAIDVGPWSYLWGVLCLLCTICGLCMEVFHLKNLKNRLLQGERLNHNKDWRKYAHYYRTRRVLYGIAILVCIVFLKNNVSNDPIKENTIPIKNYSGVIPFSTMEDLIPNSDFYADGFQSSNTITIRSDWMAPTFITLYQSGSIRLEGNRILNGCLTIDYYETISPWIAKELGREYVQNVKQHTDEFDLNNTNMDIDYARAYVDDSLFYSCILVENNKIMHVSFRKVRGSYTLQIEDWIQIFAANLAQ